MTTMTVRSGAIMARTIDRCGKVDARVIPTPQEIRVPAGAVVAEFPTTGYRMILVPTGRTVARYRMACPTFTRHEIDTVADENGAVWGEAGEQIPGTWFTRPENVIGS